MVPAKQGQSSFEEVLDVVTDLVLIERGNSEFIILLRHD